MKAAYIESTGAAEATIKYGDVPQPTPTAQQVLVKVAAVAVNPIDTYLRNGANYWELPKPFIIGCDLAGTVDGGRPGGQAIQSRRPCVGQQSGAARPARDVCRVLRGG